MAWGDYDNDGDLDILLSGREPGGALIARVFQNLETTANRVPNAPSGLTQTVNSPTSAALSWTAPTDQTSIPSGTGTPTAGLSYNLRVGTTLGGSDVLGPMAFQTPPAQTDGLRKIAHSGLVQTTSWTLDNLTPGQTYYWSVQAIDTALAGSHFANETTFATPLPEADLAITKTDGVTTAAAGGSVTYTITASNAGPSDASGASVADTFPASEACTWTCVGAGGGTCTASGSGNISDTVNLPSGGSTTYTASCTVSAAASGSLSNTATVTAPGSVTDPTPGNNSATDTDTLHASANLSITKTDGVTTATPGGSVTYTITASNSGPGNVTGATVTDTFPASLTVTSWSCVGAGGGTCTASGSGNISDTVNLPSGGSVTYSAACAVSTTATSPLANTASVTAPNGITDPILDNNSATDLDTVVAISGTPPGSSGPVQVALSGGGNGCGFTAWQFQAPPNPPEGVNFVDGVFAFTASPCTGSPASVTLTFTYPTTLPRETQYWKYGPLTQGGAPQWHALPATVQGNQLTVQFTDGGTGDDDFMINGAITDTGGAAYRRALVPTLSQWALVAMGILLGGVGWRSAARRLMRRPSPSSCDDLRLGGPRGLPGTWRK